MSGQQIGWLAWALDGDAATWRPVRAVIALAVVGLVWLVGLLILAGLVLFLVGQSGI